MGSYEEEMVESWINGNRSYVKKKLKRSKLKVAVLDEAKAIMNKEDLDDFIKNALI